MTSNKDERAEFIELADGAKWHFGDDWTGDVHLSVIAASLSKLCRYTGHCKKFYSVAEHSVLCSYLVPPGCQFEALMHDAHECIVNDLSRPFKNHIGGSYKDWENKIETQVRRIYGLTDKISPIVKKADIDIFKYEVANIMPSRGLSFLHESEIKAALTSVGGVLKEHGQYLSCLSPDAAEERFLLRLKELYLADLIPSEAKQSALLAINFMGGAYFFNG